eukprot:scaffold544_cov320-Pavlova_lutheri.AAC.36
MEGSFRNLVCGCWLHFFAPSIEREGGCLLEHLWFVCVHPIPPSGLIAGSSHTEQALECLPRRAGHRAFTPVDVGVSGGERWSTISFSPHQARSATSPRKTTRPSQAWLRKARSHRRGSFASRV